MDILLDSPPFLFYTILKHYTQIVNKLKYTKV